MLHFDSVPNLIDCELHKNKHLRRFHALNVPPETREKRIKNTFNFILFREFFPQLLLIV